MSLQKISFNRGFSDSFKLETEIVFIKTHRYHNHFNHITRSAEIILIIDLKTCSSIGKRGTPEAEESKGCGEGRAVWGGMLGQGVGRTRAAPRRWETPVRSHPPCRLVATNSALKQINAVIPVQRFLLKFSKSAKIYLKKKLLLKKKFYILALPTACAFEVWIRVAYETFESFGGTRLCFQGRWSTL